MAMASVGDNDGLDDVDGRIDGSLVGEEDCEGIDDMIRLGEAESDAPPLGVKDGETDGSSDGVASVDNAVGVKDGSELGLNDNEGNMVPANDGDLDSDGSSVAVSVGLKDELGDKEG
mmetsp:Transcript_16226/g.34096  ORF Transcript_16226/g.34096 Transcript_16226/m.34096 type:complete len:117 (+) Transcript_16226:337-687(+)